MSGNVFGYVWSMEIEQNMKYVLLAYADHADYTGNNIYPSINTIARKTGKSERQVQRITHRLVEAGHLVPDSDTRGGRGNTVIYHIPMQEIKGDILDVKGDIQEIKGDISKQKGDILDVKGDIAVSPEPLTLRELKREPLTEDAKNQTAAPARTQSSAFIINVFSEVTGMTAIPASELDKVIPVMHALQAKFPTQQELIDYLRPFYAWWTSRRSRSGRQYSKTNCAWLYDLAVSGEIPDDSKPVSVAPEPKSFVALRQYAEEMGFSDGY